MKELEAELLAFPMGRHDDFVDTLAYAVLEIAGRSVYEDHGLLTV
jgi:phage terminase large subunit-like protein